MTEKTKKEPRFIQGAVQSKNYLQDLIEMSQIQEQDNVECTDLDAPVYFELSKNEKQTKKMPDQKIPRTSLSDSLNTDYFYQSKTHDEALIKMKMSIEHHLSFGLVIGPSGTGKSYLSQLLLETLPKNQYLAVLINVTPNLTPRAFLQQILQGLSDEPLPKERRLQPLIEILAGIIIKKHQAGLKPVFLIDEAHFLSSQSLHLLRTLSNFESSHQKIITSILFAEPPFYRRLSQPSYASLKSRIYLEIDLKPLDHVETEKYLSHRLQVEGFNLSDIFNENQIDEITQQSGGVPRLINKAALNQLFDQRTNKV